MSILVFDKAGLFGKVEQIKTRRSQMFAWF